MWFKNLRLYRLTKPFNLSPEALHEQLTEKASRPCAGLEPSTYGWTAPLGRHSELLTHAANGYIMICTRKEEKVLPATVVQEILAEKVAVIEDEQARTVRRNEREELRQGILVELLPKAFSKSSRTYAYIDAKGGWLVVDASSASKAEELVSLLRETLGTLPAIPPTVHSAPASILTHWLNGLDLPAGYTIEDQCELRDPSAEGAIVRCTKQDLLSDEIQTHLKAGKQATKLAIAWHERLTCVLCDDLSVKRLRFTDIIQERAADEAADEASRFDADFALMTLELSRFIPSMMDAFGGEERSSAD
ncbi:MAG: recombination-associated protein RdgC [Candidatus Polarisedimenticolaceae bacterium]|nr:recombination-associated protein RdgC [Candidatus Polarisedimenticolaceae bacterium]